MTDDKDVGKNPDSEEQDDKEAVSPATDVPDDADASAEQPSEADAAAESKPDGAENNAENVEAEGDLPSPDEFGVVNDEDASQEDAEEAMLEMLDGLPNEGPGSSAEDIEFTSASASKAQFQQLQQPAGTPEPQNIELLMDVDLPVSIELGRTKMPISEILALGPGSVVELNKLAGEPVDLLVNHKVVAKGEVVVVDENFGLRVTQLITPEERLKALAEE